MACLHRIFGLCTNELESILDGIQKDKLKLQKRFGFPMLLAVSS